MSATTTVVQDLPVAKIHASKFNPRKTFRNIEELAADLADHGVLQPITVRPNADGHEIVFGERRWRAAKVAKLATMPCIVRELDDATALELMIVENCQRDDVHPVEEAEGYAALAKTMSVDDIAAKVNKSRSHVYARIKLCSLIPEAKAACVAGDVSPSVALLLARIPDPKVQAAALKEVTQRNHHGDLRSYRELADVLQRGFTNEMKDAPWDLKDATLVPAAGACAACPHRSGNQGELFGEAVAKSPDVCTSPKCWKEKGEAHWKRRSAEAEKKGLRVLTDREAKKVFSYQWDERPQNGMVDLTARAYEADPVKQRPWKTLLGKSAAEVTVLARDKKGEIRELADPEKLQTLLKEKHPELAKRPAPASSMSAAEKKRNAAAKVHNAAARAAMGDLVEAITKCEHGDLPEDFYRVLAELVVQNAHHQARKEVVARRQIPIGKAGLDKALRDELLTASWQDCAALAMELLCAEHAFSAGYRGQDTWGRELKMACDAMDVDWAAHVAKAKGDAKPAKKKGAKKK